MPKSVRSGADGVRCDERFCVSVVRQAFVEITQQTQRRQFSEQTNGHSTASPTSRSLKLTDLEAPNVAISDSDTHSSNSESFDSEGCSKEAYSVSGSASTVAG